MDDCKDVLIYTSKMERTIIEKKSDYEKFLKEWLISTTYEEYMRMKASGWDADTDFEWFFVVDGDGSSSSNEEEFKKFQNELRSGKELTLKSTSNYKEVEERINQYAIKAWENCIIEKVGKKDPSPQIPFGLNHQITKIGNNKVKIKIHYIRHSEEDEWPIIKQIIVSGGHIEENSIKVGDVVDNFKLLMINRVNNEILDVTIITSKGNIDFQLPSADEPPLILKKFIFQLNLKTIKPSTTYSCKVPSEYKIISGFPFELDVFGFYPVSLNEWRFETGHIVMTSDQKWNLILTALYDPQNEWDVAISSDTVDKETKCETTLSEGYLITGGAFQYKVHWRSGDLKPRVGHICETEGTINYYPKDEKTFYVQIKGACNLDETGIDYSLTAYAIGLKRTGNPGIQHLIEKKEAKPGYYDLSNKSFELTGFLGFSNEIQPDTSVANMPLIVSGHLTYHLDTKRFSSMFGIGSPGLSSQVYLIGISHPHLSTEYMAPEINEI